MNEWKLIILGAVAAVLLFLAGRWTAPCGGPVQVTLGRDSIVAALLDSANYWRGAAAVYRDQRDSARAMRDTFEAHIEEPDQLRNRLSHAIRNAGLSAAADNLNQRAE